MCTKEKEKSPKHQLHKQKDPRNTNSAGLSSILDAKRTILLGCAGPGRIPIQTVSNTPANRQSKLHTERVSIHKGIEKGEKNGMDKLPRKIL